MHTEVIEFELKLEPTRYQRLRLNTHFDFYCRYYNKLCRDYSEGRKRHTKSSLIRDRIELRKLREKFPQMRDVNGYVFASAIKDFHDDVTKTKRPPMKDPMEAAFKTEQASLKGDMLIAPRFKEGVGTILQEYGFAAKAASMLRKAKKEVKLHHVTIGRKGRYYYAMAQCDVAIDATSFGSILSA